LTNAIKKRSICFILSDFLATGYSDALKLANRKHDVVALRINDPGEQQLPDVGIIRMYDPESGIKRLIDTSDPNIRSGFHENLKRFEREFKETLASAGVDVAELHTDQPYIQSLMRLFKKRGRK
ncbi:MAG: DUF58 domain-containing protein, partial [Bacteroidota bacterium]